MERLQEFGKRKELERLALEQEKKSIQASAHDKKIASLLVTVVKTSISSFYKVWKDLSVKNKGRRLQIDRTLKGLAGRRMRLRMNTSWQGWWEQTLQRRRARKVLGLVTHHLFMRCHLRWVQDVKMMKMAKLFKLVGEKEEGQLDRLKTRSWQAWKLHARHQATLRRAMNLITGSRVGKTLADYLNTWRSAAAASVLSKAGFGAKAKDKSAIRRTGSGAGAPGLRRTGSSEALGPGRNGSGGIRRSGSFSRLDSSASAATRAPVGRTMSPGLSSTASFASIHEDSNSASPGGDQPESAFHGLSRTGSAASQASQQAYSPLGLRRNVNAQTSQDSVSSVASSASAFHRAQSLRRQPSEQSAGSHLGEKDQAVAHEAISSEAFLSTLLRKGSVQRI